MSTLWLILFVYHNIITSWLMHSHTHRDTGTYTQTHTYTDTDKGADTHTLTETLGHTHTLTHTHTGEHRFCPPQRPKLCQSWWCSERPTVGWAGEIWEGVQPFFPFTQIPRWPLDLAPCLSSHNSPREVWERSWTLVFWRKLKNSEQRNIGWNFRPRKVIQAYLMRGWGGVRISWKHGSKL